jgi:glycosyltransferase involved in cell wall biosynthesis
MTKIAILATARQGHGGTFLYTLSMIDAMRRLPQDRYQLTLFTTQENHEYDDIGLPIVRLGGFLALTAARLGGKDPFASVDKVIAPIYSIALLTARRPFTFTLHDLQEKHYPENFSLATRVWRIATNLLLTARANSIVCESKLVQQDIVRYFGIPASRVAVVPAPPIAMLKCCQFDVQEIAAIRRKFDLPDSYIFYPAQFWPHKNHRRLIEAFARVAGNHQDCSLVLTGKERGEYRHVLEKVEELGLTEKVRHVGYVEHAELAALYHGAKVIAIPTLFESISLPVYEAFSLGVPVCASNVAALPEQIGDAGLLFDPFSIEDMADKISRLLVDPALRQQLIERGRRRMISVTHDGYAQRLREIIDAMGESPSAAGRYEPGC